MGNYSAPSAWGAMEGEAVVLAAGIHNHSTSPTLEVIFFDVFIVALGLNLSLGIEYSEPPLN